MSERLFVFNPDCELAIANGSKYYMPPANIVQMASDLAFLPAFTGEQGDAVLVKRLPDRQFLQSVCIPLRLGCKAVLENDTEQWEGMKGEPWGLSPAICHWFKQRQLGEDWRPEQKEWYSRKMAKQGLEQLLDVLPFIEKSIVPEVCFSIEDIERRFSGEEYLVKAPWSSSGKGILMLKEKPGIKEKEWLRGMFRRQGYLMLERKLDKVMDFAMEFHRENNRTTFFGWSVFTTGNHGEYRGNYAGPQERIEKKLRELTGCGQLNALKQAIIPVLDSLFPFYKGYLGVDMMIYRNERKELCLHPCVEINLRYNMGIIALFLSRNYLWEGVEGQFSILYYPSQGEAFHEDFRLKAKYPLVHKNNRIISGYLNLTPVDETTHFVASLICY